MFAKNTRHALVVGVVCAILVSCVWHYGMSRVSSPQFLASASSSAALSFCGDIIEAHYSLDYGSGKTDRAVRAYVSSLLFRRWCSGDEVAEWIREGGLTLFQLPPRSYERYFKLSSVFCGSLVDGISLLKDTEKRRLVGIAREATRHETSEARIIGYILLGGLGGQKPLPQVEADWMVAFEATRASIVGEAPAGMALEARRLSVESRSMLQREVSDWFYKYLTSGQ